MSVTAFKPGDRIAVHHIGGCGDCVDCRRGFDMKCQHKWGIYGLDRPGALQDYMLVRSRDCVVVPENIDFDEAAYYTCGAGTVIWLSGGQHLVWGTVSPLSASAQLELRPPTSH